MTWIKELAMAGLGLSFGLMVAGGVFTVLIVVGLVPRFAGKTHTARYEVLYEEFIIAGTVIGCIFSVFQFPYRIGEMIGRLPQIPFTVITVVLLITIGIFSGMFVGCLSLALAEMLDATPIFTRRIGFRHGLGVIVLAIALGKLCGSLIYFCMRFMETM